VKLITKNILLITPLILFLSYCMSCSNILSDGPEIPFSPVVGEIDSSVSSSVILPEIQDIPDQYVENSNSNSNLNLIITPFISNTTMIDGTVNWTKNFGPDGVLVHPETGHVTWDIDSNMPTESFHIGLKASSQNESVYAGFIVHVGLAKDKVITVGSNGDYQNLKMAMINLASGGTIVILDGIYTGENNYIGRVENGSLQHPPSGSRTAYTTIMAEHPGRAILEDGAYVRFQALAGNDPVSYIAIKGLFVKGGQLAAIGYEDSTLRHHHLKFIRNGAQGGSRNLDPFSAYRVDDILFENNYAFGGGRYKFASYQSSNIVWRRNVARYDRGPVPDEPKGTYSVYSTMDAFLSNNIAVDGDKPDFLDLGEIAGEFATPTTAGPTRARFQRNIQLNSAMMFTNLSNVNGDSDVELSHMVSWDVRPDKSYVKSFASGWLDHITMGDINSRNHADQFFNGWDNYFRGITNSILHNFQNGNMFYSLKKQESHETVDGRIVERYGADTLNITNFNGQLEVYDSDIDNITHIDPLQSESNPEGGLRYITRVERGTSLSALDQNDNSLGATVLTFVGESGTLFGEPGYDQETYIPMWPFPMENIIKEKMKAYSYTGDTYTGTEQNRVVSGTGTINGARGFAVEGQTLTNYIWGYLGDAVPPFNVTATADNNSIIVQWQASPSISQSKITGYKVYDYNIESGERTLLAELSNTQMVTRINGVNAKVKHALAVTSLEGNKESAIGYPVIIYTK
jgi:hypothetical protein